VRHLASCLPLTAPDPRFGADGRRAGSCARWRRGARGSGRLSLDVCTVKPYIYGREDLERSASRASAPHRGRRQPGASPDLAKRLRNILGVLIIAEDMTKVIGPPGWRVHQLKGDRAGTWSISVSGNWRLTFDVVGGDICSLNLEDYH
jgi:proteic killer suppression protein